ncbi:hypothetical protein E1301_Tti010792 [Triplophysa tibetana]|uniref:Ig-like domain-containing protein n=1 Tax=Triplophysa tibetana TaxID=1572043 RepID=A0A5A9N0C6_9TELE|nr:hypothetical protein E1301_Tti010792 [Triplophysa tibetana]
MAANLDLPDHSKTTETVTYDPKSETVTLPKGIVSVAGVTVITGGAELSCSSCMLIFGVWGTLVGLSIVSVGLWDHSMYKNSGLSHLLTLGLVVLLISSGLVAVVFALRFLMKKRRMKARRDRQEVPVTGVNITGPNSTLVEGKSSANLNCDGNGTITNTQWIKDGQHLSESDTITFSADNRSMLINPVNRSDIGEYVCVRSNPISSEMANYSITVLYGPDVKILGAEILEEGSDILLYCSVSSVPLATLTWTVNDTDVGNSALYITRSSNSDHSGIYTCTASNPMTGLTNSAQHTVTLRDQDNTMNLSKQPPTRNRVIISPTKTTGFKDPNPDTENVYEVCEIS